MIIHNVSINMDYYLNFSFGQQKLIDSIKILTNELELVIEEACYFNEEEVLPIQDQAIKAKITVRKRDSHCLMILADIDSRALKFKWECNASFREDIHSTKEWESVDLKTSKDMDKLENIKALSTAKIISDYLKKELQ